MFLARMITRSKWEPKPGVKAGEISADAVTGDLRTHDNALSFWRCSSGEGADFEDTVLAIATGRTDIAKVEIVWLDDEDLRADGQTLEDTEGRTPVEELAHLHVDLCRLDFGRLGKVARRVVSALNEKQYLCLTRASVKNLLEKAVNKGRVDPRDLQDKVRNEVQMSLTTSK